MTDDTAADTAPRSRLVPRLLLALGSVLFGYLLLEAAVFVMYRPVAPEPLEETPADTPDLRAGREQAGLGFRDPSMCVHPYLGYVFLPNEEREKPGPPAISISQDGFLDSVPAVRERGEGRLIIGVTGGSVAGQLGTWHASLLVEALKAFPEFAELELDLVWLGMPGYHQPQQVIQLAYLLGQGAEFDVFINLDGFNEIAVPTVLNAPKGTHPLFPMNWSMVALDVPDTRVRRYAGAVDYLTRERHDRAARFQESFWSFSPTARLLRQLDDRKLQLRIAEYSQELQDLPVEDVPWFVRGPESLHLPRELLMPECVKIWERCSRQLHALCEAHGIRYLHFLQPNQYDPGSKPLSSDEKKLAYDPDGPYRPVAEEGYPLLRDAGVHLQESGIAFHDLSGIFSGVEETVYVDVCCHFNAVGNRIMARAIAETLTRYF